MASGAKGRQTADVWNLPQGEVSTFREATKEKVLKGKIRNEKIEREIEVKNEAKQGNETD